MVAQDQTASRLQPVRQESGFTLVELMISVAVITMLAGMAAQTFRAVMTARDIAVRRLEVNETARAALDFMSSELRAAYLTPDSVKPVVVGGFGSQNTGPRLRFAGISRDIVVEPDSSVPGAGKDDDGDGLIDEEVLDGFDGDYAGGAQQALRGESPGADPLGCDPGDSACIDEDIGLFPSDILHFVSAVESSGDIILQEISYGLDPSGTRLVRRGQVLNLNNQASTKTQLLDFGQFIDDASLKPLVAQPVPIGQIMRKSFVQQAELYWDDGAEDGAIGEINSTNQNPGHIFQVLSYDIRGLRFRYWYYDYNRGGWRMVQEWDSSRETALVSPDELLFNKLARSSNSEYDPTSNNVREDLFTKLIVNEPEDMYPRIPGGGQGVLMDFLIKDPRQLRNSVRNAQNSQFIDVYQRIAQKTDGLPNMVEITIYVQDKDRENSPKQYSTRVFLPNNYRSIGNL